MKVANSITDFIGKTPMVKINKLTGLNDATIYAKQEWYNIGGSVKGQNRVVPHRVCRGSGKVE